MDKNATVVVFKLVHNPMAFGQNLDINISCANLVDLDKNMNRNLCLISSYTSFCHMMKTMNGTNADQCQQVSSVEHCQTTIHFILIESIKTVLFPVVKYAFQLKKSIILVTSLRVPITMTQVSQWFIVV
jgi:hypothetical protein